MRQPTLPSKNSFEGIKLCLTAKLSRSSLNANHFLWVTILKGFVLTLPPCWPLSNNSMVFGWLFERSYFLKPFPWVQHANGHLLTKPKKMEKMHFCGGFAHCLFPKPASWVHCPGQSGKRQSKEQSLWRLWRRSGATHDHTVFFQHCLEFVATVTSRRIHRNQILQHWITSRLVAPSHIVFTP